MTNIYDVELTYLAYEAIADSYTQYERFEIEAYDIVEAVRKLDKVLSTRGLTNNPNDYTTTYSADDTSCEVNFADYETGQDVLYLIELQE